ncbi:MAG: hypothetical protein ABW022_13005 [Actinoplanes sp.]
MAAREPKLAGRHKLTTMRKLASGLSHADVARDMDVTPPAVTAFAQRNAEAIAEIKADLKNEYAGLWIAKKEARIAELQRLAEDMQAELEERDDEGNLVYDGSTSEGRRVVMAAMRQASEELGQLVAKADLTQKQEVKYRVEIEGGDLT